MPALAAPMWPHIHAGGAIPRVGALARACKLALSGSQDFESASMRVCSMKAFSGWADLGLLGRFCRMAVLAIAGGMLAAGPAQAQGAVKQTFGDWELRCEAQSPGETAAAPAAGPGEQCYLYQNVADASSDRLNLIIAILRVPDPKKPDSRKLILRVLAPVGVLLPRGLGLKLDDADIGSTGFVRCWPYACIAEVDIDKNLQDQFVAAKQATFFFAVAEDEMRGLPINLDKLGDGIAALQ
jgi:invasion protein IalB